MRGGISSSYMSCFSCFDASHFLSEEFDRIAIHLPSLRRAFLPRHRFHRPNREARLVSMTCAVANCRPVVCDSIRQTKTAHDNN